MPLRRSSMLVRTRRIASLAAMATLTALIAGAGPAGAAPAKAAHVTNLTGAYLAARSAQAQRDIGAAADFYNLVLKADPGNADLLQRTFILYLGSGNTELSLQLAEQLVKIDPSNEMAQLLLALRALKDGATDAVAPHLAPLGRGALSKLTVGLVGAWAKYGTGDADGALKAIADLEGEPFFGIFKNYHSGLMAEADGRPGDAVKFFRDSYDQDASIRSAEALARSLAESGDRTAAEAVLDEFLARSPGQPSMRTLLADIKAGKEIKPQVKTAIDGAAEVMYQIANALAGDDGMEISSFYLRLALFANPTEPLGLIALGQIQQSLELHEEALELFNRLPPESPLYSTALVQAAVSLGSLERYDEAIARLKPVVDGDPSDLTAVLTLGNLYRGQKLFAEAADTYTKGIATVGEPDRGHWTLFYFRGICFERSKRWPEAEADFKEALKLFPNQPQVLNYLGYSWVDRGTNLQEALEMIQLAVNQRPEDGYIVDSLGWAYYRLGQYDRSVVELERAVELMPQDPVINDHLGDAYWRVGRRLEAVFQWRHAKELDPEPEDLTRIVQKLETGIPETAAVDRDG